MLCCKMDMNYFDYIPDDQVLLIAVELDSTRIAYLCRTNIRFSNIICNNNRFWQLKFIHDFGIPNYRISDWKSAYENYGTTIILNERIPLKIKCKYITCKYNRVVMIDLDNNVWAIFDDVILEREDEPFLLVQIPDIKGKFVATAAEYLMIIDFDDNIFVMNHGSPGKLENNHPVRLDNLKAKFAAGGYNHSMIIDLDNNVWSFGHNELGQLGLGDNLNRDTLTQIPNLKGKFISCGSDHTIIIDLDNNIYSFGENKYGQLGLGDNLDRNTPTQILHLKAESVACGTNHTVILDLDNNVWGVGNNELGQLGLGNNFNINIAARIFNLRAKQIACGDRSTMILDFDNNVWIFGLNDYEIKAVPTQIPNLKARFIAAASTFLLAIEITNKHIVSYNEIAEKISSGEVDDFEISPDYQTIPHHTNNIIATFKGKDDYIYLAELRYNNVTNEIFPPIL